MMTQYSNKPEILTLIKNITGKHIKQTLTRLESQDILTQDIRKIVLDEFNDFCRDLLQEFELEEIT